MSRKKEETAYQDLRAEIVELVNSLHLHNNRIEALIDENGMESFQKLAEPYRAQPKLIKNVDFTIEDELYVFSKWYLIKQGSCCKNGCKNCPY